MKKTPTLLSVLDEIALYFKEGFEDPKHDKHQLCLRLSHFKKLIESHFSDYQVATGIKQFKQARCLTLKFNPVGSEKYKKLLEKSMPLLTDGEKLALAQAPPESPYLILRSAFLSENSLAMQIDKLRICSLGQDITSKAHSHFIELLRLLSVGNCTDIKECIRLGVNEFSSTRVPSPLGEIRLNPFSQEVYANALLFIQSLDLVTPDSCARYRELHPSHSARAESTNEQTYTI